MSNNKLRKKGLQLSEKDIRRVMSHTTSNLEASRFLGVSYNAWRKYAEMYYDEETGLNLYDYHTKKGKLNKKKLFIPRSSHRSKAMPAWTNQLVEMQHIFDNKHPNYNRGKFIKRLFREGWLPEKCDICGYSEMRKFDLSVPLYLLYLDGNKNNMALNNLRFVCYNCHYIHYKSISDSHVSLDESGELIYDPKLPRSIKENVYRKVPTPPIDPEEENDFGFLNL